MLMLKRMSESVFKYQSRFKSCIKLCMIMLVFLLGFAIKNKAATAAILSTKEDAQLSIAVQNIQLGEALLLIAKFAHKNILISPTVSGTTSLQFDHANPNAAFNLLLRTHHLTEVKEGDIYFIAPIDEVLKQQQTEVLLQQLQQKSAPLITIVEQIKYSSAKNIAALIKDERAGFLSSRGQVKVDMRTNRLAIQDIASRVVSIKKLIRALDVPAQQVLIEARIASIDTDCERELGLHFDAYPSTNLARQSAQNGRYSIAIGHLADGSLLDIKLAALERRGQAELISSPSLSTTNQEQASIEAGEEVPYQEVSESGGTAVTFKKAVLGLKVTPEILPHHKVLLRLQINQDRPSNKLVQGVPTINTRRIVTHVLVSAGKTVVLGGIYESNQERLETGIPYLQRIPILGWLFKTENRMVNKRELLIFVTPKIALGSYSR